MTKKENKVHDLDMLKKLCLNMQKKGYKFIKIEHIIQYCDKKEFS